MFKQMMAYVRYALSILALTDAWPINGQVCE
jgi:hypothetical protein